MRAILTYHSIDNSGSPVSVTPAAFRQHIEWLASGSTRVLSLGDIVHGSQSDDAVALTFDDGFENFSTEAWPLLRAHRFPATLFVVTGQVGRTNAWQGREEPGIPTLPLLGWAALERLAGDGCHSRDDRLFSLDSAKKALGTACVKAKLPHFGHHAMRHFFCSNAIEAGCDFKVIAGWLGHKDGGVLVAMTYGHLRNEHSVAMAKRMTFSLNPIPLST